MNWPWRVSGHDPEGGASAYLAGEQPRRARRRFEAHLLSCEECWGEVDLARRGRAIAEGAREMAPAQLREDVRGAVTLLATSTGRDAINPRLRIVVPTIAVVLAGMLGAGALIWTSAHRQPEPIAAALSSYRTDRVPAAPAAGPAPDLGSAGLRVTGAGRGMVGEMAADVFAYQGSGGARLFLYISNDVFPEARGANGRPGMANGWTARDHDLFIVCHDHPVSYLLIADDQVTATRAEQALAAEV